MRKVAASREAFIPHSVWISVWLASSWNRRRYIKGGNLKKKKSRKKKKHAFDQEKARIEKIREKTRSCS